MKYYSYIFLILGVIVELEICGTANIKNLSLIFRLELTIKFRVFSEKLALAPSLNTDLNHPPKSSQTRMCTYS